MNEHAIYVNLSFLALLLTLSAFPKAFMKRERLTLDALDSLMELSEGAAGVFFSLVLFRLHSNQIFCFEFEGLNTTKKWRFLGTKGFMALNSRV